MDDLLVIDLVALGFLSVTLLIVGILCVASPRTMQAVVLTYYYRGCLRRVAELFPGHKLIRTRFFLWVLRLFGVACLIFSSLIVANLLSMFL